jgi:hypothetical protein
MNTPRDDRDQVSESALTVLTPGMKYVLKKRTVKWSKDNEDLLVEWGDVGQAYRWMTNEAYHTYKWYHMWFTIPVITLSTVIGSVSFATSGTAEPHAPLVVGAVNILVGTLTTIQQYLKIAEFKEAYRNATISWDKFSRNIRIELAKHPEERSDCFSFMKHVRGEMERLTEMSPDISGDIVARFERHFHRRPGFDTMKKPHICDVLESTENARHPYFKPRGREPPQEEEGAESENLGNPTLSDEILQSFTTLGRYTVPPV